MNSDRFIHFGYAVAIILLVAFAIFGEQSVRQLKRSYGADAHTWRFLLETERVHSSLKEMEKSQQAFLLTGKARYAEDFRLTASRILPRINDLRADRKIPSELVEPLARLAELARSAQHEWEAAMRLRQEHGAASLAQLDGRPRRLISEIDRLMSELSRKSESASNARGEAMDIVVNRASVAAVAGSLLAIGLFGIALFLFQRSGQAQRRSEQSLAEASEQSESQRQKIAALVEAQNLVAKALQETERALAESRQRAQSATRAKSEFLANMSHEIRTPLNGILGMTSILLDSGLNGEQTDHAKTIQRSGESLLGLLNDILDFSKVEAGKIDFEVRDFDLAASLRDVLKTFQYAIKRKGIELIAEIPEGEHFYQGDPGRLRQVLVNLLGNAIKFTEKGKVTLRLLPTSLQSGYTLLRFEVQDTGIGIEDRTVPHLFRAFSQGDASTTRKFGGTGLGLFISRRLVEAMGGEIGVASVKGQGSTFWFELKLKPAGRVTPAETSAEIRPMKGKYRILVAEDNEVNQKIVLRMLEKMGVRAECVVNGAEVIEALRKRSYDLILMDCQMPVMDGYEATARVRADRVVGNNEIPIIAMTANAMKGDREHCLAAGMNDYLAKPLSVSLLAETLEKWIAQVEAKKDKASSASP